MLERFDKMDHKGIKLRFIQSERKHVLGSLTGTGTNWDVQ